MSNILTYTLIVLLGLIIYAASWGFRENKVKASGRYWPIVEGVIFAALITGISIFAEYQGIPSYFLTPISLIVLVAVFVSPLSALIAIIPAFLVNLFASPSDAMAHVSLLTFQFFLISVVFLLRELRVVKRWVMYLVATLMGASISLLIAFKIDPASAKWYYVAFGVFIFPTILYVGASFIKNVYDHSQELQHITQYDDIAVEDISRPAFAAAAMKDFVIERKIETGALVIIELVGMKRISSECGEKISSQFVKTILEKISLLLINTEFKLLKSSSDHYGFFMGLDQKITNIEEPLDGNSRLSRSETDPVKMVEDILLEIPRMLQFDDKVFRIQVRGGVSLYGIQSCNFATLIEYSEYTLKSKNWFRSTNIAQVYDTTAHKQFIQDKKEIAYLEDITNPAALYTKYAPVVPLDASDEIHAYEFKAYTDDNKYFSISDVEFEAKKHGLTTVLEKVIATIAVNTFRTTNKFEEKTLFIDFPAEAFINEYYNELNLLRKLASLGYNTNNVVLQLRVTEEIVSHRKFIKTLEFFRKANIKISIAGIENDTFNPDWLIKLKPEYATISIKSTRMWFNAKETLELISTYNDLCNKVGTALIVNDVRSTYQLKQFVKIGIKYVTGSIVSVPEHDNPRLKYSFRHTMKKLRGVGE